MRRVEGFALLQALFFMMFIMAAISIAMMMSAQKNNRVGGERMAVDAFPALSVFLTYATPQLTDDITITGEQYFADHPLKTEYIEMLDDENISDPSIDGNLTITYVKAQ